MNTLEVGKGLTEEGEIDYNALPSDILTAYSVKTKPKKTRKSRALPPEEKLKNRATRQQANARKAEDKIAA